MIRSVLTLVLCVLLLQESITVHLKGGRGPIMVLTCDIGSSDPVNGEKSGCFVAVEESRMKTSTLHTGKNTTEWNMALENQHPESRSVSHRVFHISLQSPRVHWTQPPADQQEAPAVLRVHTRVWEIATGCTRQINWTLRVLLFKNHPVQTDQEQNKEERDVEIYTDKTNYGSVFFMVFPVFWAVQRRIL